MSYPRCIQTLIIEDDAGMVAVYRSQFDKFRRGKLSSSLTCTNCGIKNALPIGQGTETSIAPPVIVCGYSEAVDVLASDRLFHFVILDLKLPEEAGGDAEGGSARGLALIRQIANREHSPVPVLMIVTADPSQIQRMADVRDQLNQGFWYGEVVAKGLELAQDIWIGIERAWDYSDFGLQVVDEQERAWPPLSPREVDLVRRCGLRQRTAIGASLKWWSAERWNSGTLDMRPEWTKVLHGRFLLQGQDGVSRPRFFKFESSQNGQRSRDTTRRLSNKLQHIHLVDFLSSDSRSLLVTDKAGPSDRSPISLETFLKGNAESVEPSIQSIAHEISEQLRRLELPRREPIEFRSLFWAHTRPETLDSAWSKIVGPSSGGSTIDPGRLYALLKEREETLWVARRACQHGDLHMGNVALDSEGASVHAYVIDGGTLEAQVCGRDLATLEISLLLHQKHEGEASFLDGCKSFYDGNVLTTGVIDLALLTSHQRNTRELIGALRREALTELDETHYALCLLDECLRQLGGLAFGTSHNKISRPFDVVELYRLLASWICRLLAIE